MTEAVPVVVPGSKSLTIRALAAAALARGVTSIHNPLDSDDSRAALGVMRALGASIASDSDPWTVEGVAGSPPSGDVVFDARESGLTARIAVALAALRDGTTVITGSGRLPERPMGAVVTAVAPWGARSKSAAGEWPLVIAGVGGRPRGEVLFVDVSLSTQPITAVLITAPLGQEPLTIRGHGRRGSWGYVDLTADVLRTFGATLTAEPDGFVVGPTGLHAAGYTVEPDASSAVYPFVAAAITGLAVTVPGLGTESRQPDYEVVRHLAAMGCEVEADETTTTVRGPASGLVPIQADLSACPDGAVGLAVACTTVNGESRLAGLHSLRHKESDRIAALVSELQKVGADVAVEGDTLVIRAVGRPVAAVIDPHGDHRLAMAFGVLSLVDPEISVVKPGVVAKTWPGYWEMLSGLRDRVV